MNHVTPKNPGDDPEPAVTSEALVPGDVLVGRPCPFCRRPFEVGDVIKWVPGGPANRKEYAKARRGLPYLSGSPWLLHYDCGDPRGRELKRGQG
jgi:hypothetical protein